ncbi:hypothetical protein E2C01_005390 [Portunus trituberculatus]|uniref:Uncharacterized protein n=1 Tax=Portunus trituberculatus TaxID=210409 RepID=A0A5B7CTY0_PORTR|nr:hypothetical protein [Portunus trituberculatus]
MSEHRAHEHNTFLLLSSPHNLISCRRTHLGINTVLAYTSTHTNTVTITQPASPPAPDTHNASHPLPGENKSNKSNTTRFKHSSCGIK